MTRVLIALGFFSFLAACGVDGEPSSPVASFSSNMMLVEFTPVGPVAF